MSLEELKDGLLIGREFEFKYKRKEYTITYNLQEEIVFIEKNEDEKQQIFSNVNELISNLKIDDMKFVDILNILEEVYIY